jgi:hypothetical protein
MTSTPDYLLVNTHIHTPFSFSAFDSIVQAAAQARDEGLAVLGISDFNTVEGFPEFESACLGVGVYPLFNMEFIALEKVDQEAHVRWNDPKNPGIMYLCGKALGHPATFSQGSLARIATLNAATTEHLKQLIGRLNDYCRSVNMPFSFSYETIVKRFAKKNLRERHIVRALYEAMLENYPQTNERDNAFKRLLGDTVFNADTKAAAAMQELLRSRLFKAGQPIYIQEETAAFLAPEDIRRIILEGKGIPCYPVMVDDSMALNEREADCETLAEELLKRGFFAVEFIPLRNSLEILSRYVACFKKRDFCITFGTEHNTPQRISLMPACRGSAALSEELARTNYQGAAVLAAHQVLRKKGQEGFVDDNGNRTNVALSELVRIGDDQIRQKKFLTVAEKL